MQLESERKPSRSLWGAQSFLPGRGLALEGYTDGRRGHARAYDRAGAQMIDPATVRRWTVEEVEALPYEEGCHYEIIDGELCVSRTPRTAHQATRGNAFFALK